MDLCSLALCLFDILVNVFKFGFLCFLFYFNYVSLGNKCFFNVLSGTMLLVSSQSKDQDMLWTISSDSFPFHKQLMEAHVSIN